MSQLNVQNLSNENEDGAPEIANIADFSATSYMCPPKGTTAQRPSSPNPGDIRFNTDTASLEYYRGNTIGWTQIEMTSPDLDGGARIVYAGGSTPSLSKVIDFVTVSTLGDATDFGEATVVIARPSGIGSKTRGLVAGGESSPTFVNTIEFITFSSTGNAANFGDQTGDPRWFSTGVANQTRGIFAGGYSPTSPQGNRDIIDYVTIAQEGNAVDFGNLAAPTREHTAGSSSTRGCFASGKAPGPTVINRIDYITIATTGDAQDFGDASLICAGGSVTNATRFVMGGGVTPGATNNIDYITMATLGNSIDFGDLSVARGLIGIGVSSDKTRGIFAGGSPSDKNIIDYITIATTGDALDFGDLSVARFAPAAMSNGHGGL